MKSMISNRMWDNDMKNIFAFALIAGFSLAGLSGPAANAAPAAKKAAASECTRCADIAKLEAEFLALDYLKFEDRKAGRKKFLRVLVQLERFNTSSRGAVRPVEFRALVALVAAALPYDTETESAESIRLVTAKSPELNRIFNDVVSSIGSATRSNDCRQQMIRIVIEERACYAENEARNTSEANDDKCIKEPVFNFDQCMGIQTVD